MVGGIVLLIIVVAIIGVIIFVVYKTAQKANPLALSNQALDIVERHPQAVQLASRAGTAYATGGASEIAPGAIQTLSPLLRWFSFSLGVLFVPTIWQVQAPVAPVAPVAPTAPAKTENSGEGE